MLGRLQGQDHCCQFVVNTIRELKPSIDTPLHNQADYSDSHLQQNQLLITFIGLNMSFDSWGADLADCGLVADSIVNAHD